MALFLHFHRLKTEKLGQGQGQTLKTYPPGASQEVHIGEGARFSWVQFPTQKEKGREGLGGVRQEDYWKERGEKGEEILEQKWSVEQQKCRQFRRCSL